MKIYAAAALFLLAGCASTPEPAPVDVKSCVPPTELMTRHPDLPVITPDATRSDTKKLSEEGALQVWKSDISAYNDLNLDNSKLIDWVSSYCK